MRAIVVKSWDSPPEFTSDHPHPTTSDFDKVTIKILASGLHQLIRSQAAGQHYSSKSAGLPYVPGADGVGTTPEGQTVYFSSIATGGGFAEYITVPKVAIVPVPDGADPVQIAGLVNPGMSSWMALAARVDNLPANFTVVIVGVTAISGKVAVEFVRGKGAGKVICVARNAKDMSSLTRSSCWRISLPRPTSRSWGMSMSFWIISMVQWCPRFSTLSIRRSRYSMSRLGRLRDWIFLCLAPSCGRRISRCAAPDLEPGLCRILGKSCPVCWLRWLACPRWI